MATAASLSASYTLCLVSCAKLSFYTIKRTQRGPIKNRNTKMGRHLSVDHFYVVFAQFKLSLEHMQHKLSFKLYDECTRSETNKQLRDKLTTNMQKKVERQLFLYVSHLPHTLGFR